MQNTWRKKGEEQFTSENAIFSNKVMTVYRNIVLDLETKQIAKI